MSFQIFTLPNADEAAEACGVRLLGLISAAIEARGAANIAVSGGSTPRLLFRFLAGANVDWNRVHLFWVDERAVPPGDPQSNFTLASENWLLPAQYPAVNIHRVPAEMPISEAASRYALELKSHFGLQDGEFPVFDIIQLGMGGDGHTASLFPGEPLVLDENGLAAAVYVEKLMAARITLLPGVLKRARTTLMLVAGIDKAAAVERVFGPDDDVLAVPARLTMHFEGTVLWYLDEAAASRMP